MMLGSGSKQLPVSQKVTRLNNQSSIVCCLASGFGVLCFVFSYSAVSTECPSVSSDSGEEKRKAITLERKQDNCPTVG